MNRSILIVICDFLLVSLIAFSNFDSLERPAPGEKLEKTVETKEAPRNEVAAALKVALEQERQSREQLANELSAVRSTAQSQQAVIAERDTKLREAEATARRTEEQRASLEQQVNAAQKNVQSMQTALSATRSEARLSSEQLQALRADLRKKQEESDLAKRKVAELELSHSNILASKQQLDARLQVTEAEKRMTTEQLAATRTQVQAIQAEKAVMQATTTKLAAGVSNLALNSSALTQEIRENRPLTANTVFNEFAQNQVKVEFATMHSGLFGQDVKKNRETQTILVTDGTKTNAICHVTDTPLTFWPPNREWEAINGFVSRGYFNYRITSLTFHQEDPRVVMIPLAFTQARSLGAKVYKVAADPFKFGDAILVGAKEGYYGECKFQIDLNTPNYVKMDRGLFRGLFGKFNPSRGDLVLSKTGELLGIMVNKEYCAVLKNLSSAASVPSGDAPPGRETTQLFDQFQRQIFTLPPKLQ